MFFKQQYFTIHRKFFLLWIVGVLFFGIFNVHWVNPLIFKAHGFKNGSLSWQRWGLAYGLTFLGCRSTEVAVVMLSEFFRYWAVSEEPTQRKDNEQVELTASFTNMLAYFKDEILRSLLLNYWLLQSPAPHLWRQLIEGYSGTADSWLYYTRLALFSIDQGHDFTLATHFWQKATLSSDAPVWLKSQAHEAFGVQVKQFLNKVKQEQKIETYEHQYWLTKLSSPF